MREERYRFITRHGELNKVWKAIFNALEIGLDPVKVNMVVIKGFNDDEVLDFVNLAYYYPLHVRFIEFMPIGDLQFWAEERVCTIEDMKRRVDLEYELYPEPLRGETALLVSTGLRADSDQLVLLDP